MDPEIESKVDFRKLLAYTTLVVFIFATTVGGFFFGPGVGFILLGLTCGVSTFLLGSE